MGGFDGKVALIVGGGRGIGRVIGETFAGQGATVVIAARTARYGERTVSTIRARGGKAFLVACDIAQRASVKAMVDAAVRLAGRIDIVVHCAACVDMGLVARMPDEVYERIVRSNIQSIFWVAKDVAPHLGKAEDKGRLIYISSGSANRQFLPKLVPYAASKAYMNAFARGLAVEFGPLGILVNVVEPGMTASDGAKARYGASLDAVAANFPLARVGQPEDIAAAVLFFAAPEASYITGASLLVDGGATMVSLGKLPGKWENSGESSGESAGAVKP